MQCHPSYCSHFALCTSLAIHPGHEDSHYYLANCLAAQGDVPGAIAELDALAQVNPQSHRAFQRKGELLASSASSRSQFEAARAPLNAALRLNSVETGTVVLLGEVALAVGGHGNGRTALHPRLSSERARRQCLVPARLYRLEAA